MEQQAYYEESTRILSGLQTGKKLWFWFCTGNGRQALLLSEFSQDPTMLSLKEKIQTSTPILGVQQYIGILSIHKDGYAEFISKKASLSMLFEVAQWCSREQQTIPLLSVFKDSVMVETADDGSIVNRYSDTSLWKNMSHQPILGTTAHGVQALEKLTKSTSAWFALANEEKGPRLIILPTAQDNTGETFATLLKSLSMHHPDTLKGTVLRGAQRLIFTCTKGTGEESMLFSLLQKEYAQDTSLFTTMKLFRVKQTKRKEIALQRTQESSQHTEPSISEDTLTALQKETLFFYFSDHGEGENTQFILHTDKEELKSKAKTLPKPVRNLRGTVSKNSKGYVVFQSSKYIEGFLPSLASWIQKQPSPKHYKSIFGARFIQKTSQGVLKKEKNDNIWSSIT